MKTARHIVQLLFLVLVVFLMQACNDRHFDDKGRLFSQYITTASGSLGFKPMMRSDSASVAAFKRDTLLYKDKPYTGGIVQYDASQNLIVEGYAANGMLDSTWKFYFASGGTLMEGKYKNGMDVGLWQSYYGFDKHRITKLYDDYGYMLMRIEYYENGRVKNYQNVRAPMFDNKERHYDMDKNGQTLDVYVEDSVLVVKQGETAERVGKNVFQQGKSTLDVAK